jgi:hypothetical protein
MTDPIKTGAIDPARTFGPNEGDDTPFYELPSPVSDLASWRGDQPPIPEVMDLYIWCGPNPPTPEEVNSMMRIETNVEDVLFLWNLKIRADMDLVSVVVLELI